MIIHYAERDITLPDDPDVTGWFEDEAEIRAAYWQVKTGDVVVDIGCHIGAYTIPALAAGATVYAVDPSRQYTGTLVGICQANQFDLTLLHIVNEALAEDGGYPVEFARALAAAPYPEHHAPADASYTTLDELAQRFGWERLDWVKIDTEGAELGILCGGDMVLRRFRPALLIEDHTDVYEFVALMDSRRRCTALLEDMGYTVTAVRYEGHLTPDRTFLVARMKEQ